MTRGGRSAPLLIGFHWFSLVHHRHSRGRNGHTTTHSFSASRYSASTWRAPRLCGCERPDIAPLTVLARPRVVVGDAEQYRPCRTRAIVVPQRATAVVAPPAAPASVGPSGAFARSRTVFGFRRGDLYG